MSRPLRLEYPGSLWHVTSRGNERRSIFRDDADRRLFLDLLAKTVDRCDWIVFAYVLMSNHFHLLLRLTAGTLSKGMHWLNGEYARAFNRRHERVGHLLQGRPHCVLVDAQTYFLEVLRYVVLNPVRAHMAGRPEDYLWSSHRAVLGEVATPRWLAIDDVLAQFGDNRPLAQARYREFVNSAIATNRCPWTDVSGQIYLGSPSWIEDVREKIALKPRSDDHPRLQREPQPLAISDVIGAVATACVTDPQVIRRGRGGTPRMLAAWIACHEAMLTNREIAAGLRLRSSTRVTQLVRQCDEALSDRAVRDLVDRSVSTLRRKNCEL